MLSFFSSLSLVSRGTWRASVDLAILRPWPQAGCWTLTVSHSVFQALGPTTAVPVTGPQVSSLQRLAGQGAAVLPQVSICLSQSLGTTPRSLLQAVPSFLHPLDPFIQGNIWFRVFTGRNLVLQTVRNCEILEWVTARNFCKAVSLVSSNQSGYCQQTPSRPFAVLITPGVS